MLTPACFRSLERHDAASRTEPFTQLTDDQWFLIEDLFDWQLMDNAVSEFSNAICSFVHIFCSHVWSVRKRTARLAA